MTFPTEDPKTGERVAFTVEEVLDLLYKAFDWGCDSWSYDHDSYNPMLERERKEEFPRMLRDLCPELSRFVKVKDLEEEIMRKTAELDELQKEKLREIRALEDELNKLKKDHVTLSDL